MKKLLKIALAIIALNMIMNVIIQHTEKDIRRSK